MTLAYELIESDAALAAFCARAARLNAIALDTEFMRERTYYSQPCLVQVCAGDVIACVDVLAIGDLSPLYALLYDPARLKVLHSARQDLEVFFDLQRRVPAPLFDTQIAAALLGYDAQIGYAALVAALTGHALAKAHTRTNWAARPLSPEQLHYAAEDVVHLPALHAALARALDERGRGAWLDEECARLAEASLYINDPAQAYLRIKQGATLDVPAQHRLRALAAWRETTAKARNLPRGWVVRDDMLVALARGPTRAARERTLSDDKNGLAAWREALHALLADDTAASDEPLYAAPHRFTAQESARYATAIAAIEQRAREGGINPALLAPRREIQRWVLGEAADLALTRGWRGALLADVLAPLRADKT